MRVESCIRKGPGLKAPRVEEVREEDGHMVADIEWIEAYRCIRTGEDHFSLVFACAWLASTDFSGSRGLLIYMRREAAKLRR